MTCLVTAVLRSGSHGDQGRQRLFLKAQRGARPMCMWMGCRNGCRCRGRTVGRLAVLVGTSGACVITAVGPKAHQSRWTLLQGGSRPQTPPL